MNRSSLWMLVASLAIVTGATRAEAQVYEPDGTQIPQPLTRDLFPAEVALFGTTEANIGLPALFASQGENIDWQNDVGLDPQVFSPLCGFTGELVLRGSGCVVDFGWYNADLANPNPPADHEIYTIIAGSQFGTVGDTNTMFHPKVGEPAVQGVLLENIHEDARYIGGLIGFALRGNPADACNQTKYSEHRLNVQSNFGGPWITAVMYRSTATPNAFYIAFEDLPMSPASFQGFPGQQYENDGDFNDFVYLIVGITCEGGGQPCLAGGEGACGFGLTECLTDGTLVCVPMVQPTDEVCDNIDNDCNGLVDDGELCPPGEVCDRGTCKPSCSGGEFPCPSPLVCDGTTGFCVDLACLDVTCDPGQVCLGGICMGGCEGVVCPDGQQCQLGRCVDPCMGRRPGDERACAEGMVCEGGVCVETCQCRVCEPGFECDQQSGACVRAGCSGVSCPAGQICRDGGCVDACEGVICPGGAECRGGKCGDPIPGHIPSGTGGGAGTPAVVVPDAGPVITLDAGPGQGDGGAAGAGNAAASGPSGSGAAPNLTAEDPGCGCRAVGGRSQGLVLPSLLLLALLRLRRRSRAQRNHAAS